MTAGHRLHAKTFEGKFKAVFAVEWIIYLIVSIAGCALVGGLIQSMISGSMAPSPDSDIYKLWKNPPIHPTMKLHLFNITNLDEWMSGVDDVLKYQEIGPYSYLETWKKDNVKFYREGSDKLVDYEMVKRFDFLAWETVGDPFRDKVVIPNIPLFAAGASMKDANFLTKSGFEMALNSGLERNESTQMFLVKTVQEVIWGYDCELTQMASMMLPADQIKTPGKFGLLAGQNLSSDGKMTVNTGQTDITRLGDVVRSGIHSLKNSFEI